MSGQTRLVAELYSRGQASMVLAQLRLVQPVQSSMALSKFLEVVPRASRSLYNSFNQQCRAALCSLLVHICFSFLTLSCAHDPYGRPAGCSVQPRLVLPCQWRNRDLNALLKGDGSLLPFPFQYSAQS